MSRVLRRQPSDVAYVLPFEEVVDALGLRHQRSLGLRVISLECIVGSVDRTREFDRGFRPTSERVRPRWERIAEAYRRGEALPPIDVYKVGELYFVEDGNHRVSVARALGRTDIEANVTEVGTEVGPEPTLTMRDLPLKSHERLFFERVPLPRDLREQIRLSAPRHYAALAEGVEAWGFRAMQGCGCHMTRGAVALAWFHEDYLPVVTSLREFGLIAEGQTDAEAYIDIVTRRYDLMRTHDWSTDIASRLSEKG